MNNIDALRQSLPTEIPLGDIAKRDDDILIITEPLVLICQTVPGYENPFWEVSNNNVIVNPVTNQTITNATTNSEIATFTVTSSRHEVTLRINLPPPSIFQNERIIETPPSIFPNELTGIYTCRSTNSTLSSSVTLTNGELYIAYYYHTEVAM